jgi:threonine dehydrogenase-like Zn-dependent dehydrogenase
MVRNRTAAESVLQRARPPDGGDVPMLAFVLEGASARLHHDHPTPAPHEGFVRVRTRVAGICNTDLELVRGYMGFNGVLGHEFVGEALEGAYAGRRVVGGINFGCGHCATCAAGLSRHCPARTVLGILGADGVLAQEFVIPERNLVAVPDAVDDETAVFTEPVAAACEVLDQLGPQAAGGRALVLGDGKLGPLAAQALAGDGFAVTLVGRHLDTIAWIGERGIELSDTVPADAAFDVVVEATGSSAGLRAAIAATRPRGSLVLKTTVAGAHEIDLAPVVINEISLIGSRCGRFAPALERLGDGRIDVKPLIADRHALANVETAFARASQPGVRKVLVRND